MLKDKVISKDSLQALGLYLTLVPYDVLRDELYTPADLFDVFDVNDPSSFERCYDTRVYQHEVEHGKQPTSRREASARAIHDTCMWNAMRTFLSKYEQTQVVGIMGGHAMLRTDASYKQTALISKTLTEKGFLIISGGGPGAMEASHLGAWMAGRSDEEVEDAIAMLSSAPGFKNEGWLATAFEVVKRYPQSNYKSLAIPTWYYGHEPPTVFATHIAKFFNNSIREDSILTEAYGGLIFMPGSAGTLQEVFQEAVQDHYISFGFASPMIFVGRKYWSEDVPVWTFLQQMMQTGQYKNLILDICDTKDEIVDSVCYFHDQHNRSNE